MEAPGESTEQGPAVAGDARHVDWLAFCRRTAEGVTSALQGFRSTDERSATVGRGEGGDMTLVIDHAAEEAVFAELKALGVAVTAISEERGRVEIRGGGPTWVVIDPIDGSLNAKRGLPFHGLSIAVAEGQTMADVQFGYVHDLSSGAEWWAELGGGARQDEAALATAGEGDRIELLGLETARPDRVAANADWLCRWDAERVRALGSVALSLCHVAAGGLDAALSLREIRSIDAAAAQLIVREAGGAVSFPDAGANLDEVSLTLEMRSRVVAGASVARLERILSDLPAPAG